MSTSDLSSVTEQLAKTKVNETYELSFKGRGLKLNNANDGNISYLGLVFVYIYTADSLGTRFETL